jgi:hypothetical protein
MPNKEKAPVIRYRKGTGGTPTPRADWEEFLKSVLLKMPADFLGFYESQNGGKPEPDLFVEGAYRLRKIYSISEIIEYRKTQYVWDLEDLPDFPPKLLAFAEDEAGNRFCIGSIDSKFSGIYYFAGDAGFEREHYLTFLVADFSSFLASLTMTLVPDD